MTFRIELAGPEGLEGTVPVAFGRQAWEVDNPGIAKHFEIICQYAGIQNTSQLTMFGQYYGALILEVLERSGKTSLAKS